MLKAAYRGFRFFLQLKRVADQAKKGRVNQYGQQTGSTSQKTKDDKDTYEAEYRVIKD